MKRSKIARAMDYLDEDLLVGALEEKPIKMDKAPKKPLFSGWKWQRFAAVAAAGVLLISGGVAVGQVIGNAQPVAVVAFDVNPSLEIEVNDKEQVVKVHTFNRDAEIIVGDMNLKKVDLEVAVNALIGSMLKNGYLSVEQNSILVSINAKDENKAEALREELSLDISALLSGSNIDACVITQTFRRGDGAQGGVSAAKAALINKVLATGLKNGDGVPYTYEKLASLKVHELKLILQSKGISVDGIQASGEASEGTLIGRERALSIAYEAAQVTPPVEELEIELDFEDGVMIYEIEFEYQGFEYEYEINGLDGEILEEEKEEIDHD